MIHVTSFSGGTVQHTAMDCARQDLAFLIEVWRLKGRLEEDAPILKTGQPLVLGSSRCLSCAYHLAEED